MALFASPSEEFICLIAVFGFAGSKKALPAVAVFGLFVWLMGFLVVF